MAQYISAFGVGAAVIGWWVASVLRLYEAQRENRHDIYAKMLGPTAEMLAALSQARAEQPTQWSARRAASYEACFAQLAAATGEVELVRKSTVSSTAKRLREALQDGLALPDAPRGDGEFGCESFHRQVEQCRTAARKARSDFILVAGRSLEGWLTRTWRDEAWRSLLDPRAREGWRYAHVKRIRAEADSVEAREQRESAGSEPACPCKTLPTQAASPENAAGDDGAAPHSHSRTTETAAG